MHLVPAAESAATRQRTKTPHTRQDVAASHARTTQPRQFRRPAPDASARRPAPPTTNARRGRRSCRAAQSSPDPASHSRSWQWPVRLRPAVLHTHAPHKPHHPVPAMPCDPACRSESMAGDPIAHRRLGPCNPAAHPIANCANPPRPDARTSHPRLQPNTPPAAFRYSRPPPTSPPHTRAHPHACSAVPRSRPARYGSRES